MTPAIQLVMQFDASLDYLVFDGKEPVTLLIANRSQLPADDTSLPLGLLPYAGADEFQGLQAESVDDALGRAPTSKEKNASGGAYTDSHRFWWLPKVNVAPGIIPKAGDIVQDARGQQWTSLEVADNVIKAMWRMVTCNLSMAFQLQDLINIERPAISYDASGAAVKAFPTGTNPPGGKVVYLKLPARVQPISEEIVDERGIRAFKGTHQITVSKQVLLTCEDRVAFGGRYYEIVGYSGAKRLDELPVVEAKLAP